MIKLKDPNDLAQIIKQSIGVFLKSKGFTESPKAPSLLGKLQGDNLDRNITQWCKLYPWKKEWVFFAYNSDTKGISLNVVLTVLTPDFREDLIIDGTNIPYLLGRKDRYYLPNFFLNLRGKWRMKSILLEINKGLFWFDQFDGPEKILERLMSPNRNGISPKHLHYQSIINHFSNLSGSAGNDKIRD